MLFDFKADQDVSMWMRNTYVSLDMIFIRGDGRIQRIAENTQTEVRPDHFVRGPGSRRTRSGDTTAKKFGIAAGDRVASPIFRR